MSMHYTFSSFQQESASSGACSSNSIPLLPPLKKAKRTKKALSPAQEAAQLKIVEMKAIIRKIDTDKKKNDQAVKSEAQQKKKRGTNESRKHNNTVTKRKV
jgi:hypothetical protein